MINIQPNGGDMNLTADQFTTIVGLTMREGLGTEYEVVEHDESNGIVWLWVHHKSGHPTRHWIHNNGEVGLSEVAHWQPTYEEAHPAPDTHSYREGGTGCCSICEDPIGVGIHDPRRT